MLYFAGQTHCINALSIQSGTDGPKFGLILGGVGYMANHIEHVEQKRRFNNPNTHCKAFGTQSFYAHLTQYRVNIPVWDSPQNVHLY